MTARVWAGIGLAWLLAFVMVAGERESMLLQLYLLKWAAIVACVLYT